ALHFEVASVKWIGIGAGKRYEAQFFKKVARLEPRYFNVILLHLRQYVILLSAFQLRELCIELLLGLGVHHADALREDVTAYHGILRSLVVGAFLERAFHVFTAVGTVTARKLMVDEPGDAESDRSRTVVILGEDAFSRSFDCRKIFLFLEKFVGFPVIRCLRLLASVSGLTAFRFRIR